MTEQHQQPNINLAIDPAVFQGHLAVTTAIPGASLTPMPINIETITSSLIVHAPNSSDLTFVTAGTVLAEWVAGIGNTNNSRSQSAAAMFIDTGSGFIGVFGTLGFGYHRNAAQGNGTITGLFEFPVPANATMRIAALRSSGAGALQFIGLGCSLLVHFFPDT